MKYYKHKRGNAFIASEKPISKSRAVMYNEITKDEYESHQQPVHRELTAKEKAIQEKKREIAKAKHYLSSTDYCVIKIAEGVATAEEYAEIISKRAEARALINQLEGELK